MTLVTRFSKTLADSDLTLHGLLTLRRFTIGDHTTSTYVEVNLDAGFVADGYALDEP
jgi:hypothetical protein